MASTDYHGKYKKLFPGILSSNSLLSVYILHLLDKQSSMYGKEIVDSITNRLGGIWEPSHGLVYPLLRSLEDEGLIHGFWEGTGSKKTKRFYNITTDGREALEKEAEDLRPVFHDSIKLIHLAMDDIYDDEHPFEGGNKDE